jgi:hypothetical protein
MVSFRVDLPQWKETQDAPRGGGGSQGSLEFLEKRKPCFIVTNRTPDITRKWLAEFHYFVLILSFHPFVYLLYFSTRRRRVKDLKTPSEGELLGWMLPRII